MPITGVQLTASGWMQGGTPVPGALANVRNAGGSGGGGWADLPHGPAGVRIQGPLGLDTTDGTLPIDYRLDLTGVEQPGGSGGQLRQAVAFLATCG